MSNIMNLKSLRNKPSRNGFDLSFKRNFTAKAGELLPVMVKEVLPGDVFNIDLSSFTRTQPVNTAAFARMREYYDFFFVPYNLLWNKADTLLTQMYDNPQHANSWNPADAFILKGEMPYITCEQIANYFKTQRSLGLLVSSIKNNYFGYQRGCRGYIDISSQPWMYIRSPRQIVLSVIYIGLPVSHCYFCLFHPGYLLFLLKVYQIRRIMSFYRWLIFIFRIFFSKQHILSIIYMQVNLLHFLSCMQDNICI